MTNPRATVTRPCPRTDAQALRAALPGDPQPMRAVPDTTLAKRAAGAVHAGEAA